MRKVYWFAARFARPRRDPNRRTRGATHPARHYSDCRISQPCPPLAGVAAKRTGVDSLIPGGPGHTVHTARTTKLNFDRAMLCRPYGTCDLGDAEVPTTEVVGYCLPSLRDLEHFAFLSAEGAVIYQPSLEGWVQVFLQIVRSEGPAHTDLRLHMSRAFSPSLVWDIRLPGPSGQAGMYCAFGAREDEVFSYLTTGMSRHMLPCPKGHAFQSSGLKLAGDQGANGALAG